MYKLSFPIGEFTAPEIITEEQIKNWIKDIESLPEQLIQVVSQLSSEQLGNQYRPSGWTGHQVVHHIADSHMNAFIRFNLTLTEETPAIRPYFQERWSELSYVKDTPIQLSVDLVKNLHARWTLLLSSLNTDDWKKEYLHPEYKYTIALEKVVGLYAWHGKHHVKHLELLMK